MIVKRSRREEAAAADVLCKGLKAKAEDEFKRKEKPFWSWAWHITHHRKEIKQLKQSLHYHEQCLNYAQTQKGSDNASKAI